MTVRRRLFWSNILMIAVPAVITALVGVLCAGMIFWVLRGDGGLGVEEHGDLSWLGSAAAEAVSGALEAGGGLDRRLGPVVTLLDEASMRLTVKELLAGISHDLRSPLTSIRAYVEGLLDGVARTPAMERQYLQIIRTKTGDIDRLVSQLFLFSELELENYPLDLQRLDLAAWLADTADSLREDYRRRGLELVLRTAPAAVQADPEQLRRVLTNILDNSAKYKVRPTGTATLTVTVRETDVLVAVSDDGPGVPDAALPKLFDAFYRTDPARKNPAGGSGLGLAIAAKGVQNMGGTIRARRAPSGGLTIVFTLPKEADAHGEDSDCGG